VVVQVSRWDRLKDMAGVMRGFAGHVLPHDNAYLLLVGPSMSGVADDPEGATVFAECLTQWNQLQPAARERVLLVTLPIDDVEENAAMVNAIQRRATVIVQKSLAEGFGLTVAEGTGILLRDPGDLAAFGSEVSSLLDHSQEAEQMGAAGKGYTREHFVGDVHLLRFAELVEATAG
jgi:trehalose synthase